MARTTSPAFRRATLEFLRGIAEDNAKDWFEAHRDLYEAGYVEPARRFVETVGPRLKDVVARASGSSRRSTARSPASTATCGSPGTSGPTRTISISGSGTARRRAGTGPASTCASRRQRSYLGSGMHMLEGEMLERFRAGRHRRAAPAGRLSETVGRVQGRRPYEIGGATRKSVPRGFDKDHERAGFLLHEGLYAGLELPAGGCRQTRLRRARAGAISPRPGRSDAGCSTRSRGERGIARIRAKSRLPFRASSPT